ncbi:MAG: hypothetical protein A3C53_01485 [Omnitrophica WOR_2 bacterium RIFCSPHIGHO2_02_FULL_68_15]|nr:MAG: hypothetical protein A3C53_01485 [Omnitrophica WOR_2 bacterium RIFCSPHIGHO2_02_FULL_68_15]
MRLGVPFQEYLKEQLKNKEFRQAYEEEGVYVEVAMQIAHLRTQKRISQKRLAKLLHTTQQNISRLENPDNASCSLRTLVKLAQALGKQLKVQFV